MSYLHFQKFLDSNIAQCRFFKWREALWLNSWGHHSLPNEDVARNIVKTAYKMDAIREYFAKPVIVTSRYRPEPYNRLEIKGSKRSSHILGLACDFVIPGIDCDVIRSSLEPFLEQLKIRMENRPGTDWVHIDLNEPGVTGRYFIP